MFTPRFSGVAFQCYYCRQNLPCRFDGSQDGRSEKGNTMI